MYAPPPSLANTCIFQGINLGLKAPTKCGTKGATITHKLKLAHVTYYYDILFIS
jgi:hypothetical protein